MSSANLLDEESERRWRVERQAERQQLASGSLRPLTYMSLTSDRVSEWIEVETILYWQTSENTNERASARVRALRLGQGARPLRFEELLGDADEGDPEKEDVDDFAALRREWREAERARGVE